MIYFVQLVTPTADLANLHVQNVIDDVNQRELDRKRALLVESLGKENDE
jgi:hypothetical protein